MPYRRSLLIAILAGAFSACRTIRPTGVQDFSRAVSTVKLQTDTAFQTVNTLTSREVVDHAAAQKTLKDENFFEVLDQGSIDHWDRSFSTLENYSQQLAQLVSGEAPKQLEDAMAGLAGQFSSTGQMLKDAGAIGSARSPSPGVAAAFVKVSSLLLGAKAESDARKIATKAEPGIQDLLKSMADQIGGSSQEGIRGAVFANLESLKAPKRDAFLAAKPGGPERRAIAFAYSKLLSQERAQDLALASLRRSILALGQAHHALAAGADFDVTSALDQLDSGLKDTRALYDRLNAERSTQ